MENMGQSLMKMRLIIYPYWILKFCVEAMWSSFSITYNLSILDFKSLSTIVQSVPDSTYNLSILDFKYNITNKNNTATITL